MRAAGSGTSRRFAWVLAAVVVGLFLPPLMSAQAATTRHYPGPAPCNTTLQACIDGSAPRDRIEIVTNTPIHESLDIDASLTLTAGSGFHPVIGGASNVLNQEIRDDGGAAIVVTISRIQFVKAKLSVDYLNFPGDRFTLTGSSVQHRIDNNNEVGVDVTAIAPGSETRIIGNSVKTTGQPVQLRTDMGGPGDTAEMTIAGNTITTSQPVNAYHGITTGLGGKGEVVLNVYSNVIHHMTGCNCGGDGAVSIDTFGFVDATVNLIGNTIDHTQGSGEGIVIERPAGASSLTTSIFNNIVTQSAARPLVLPPASSDLHVLNGWNDFFGNGMPPEFGGYAEGRSTTSVNPQYVQPATGNYRLRVGSPLRDAGDTCSRGGLPRGDAGNRFRLSGRDVDVGAYEIDAGPIPPGVNKFGSIGNDTLNGTPGVDVICGLLGGDTINGGGGGDHLFGGQGADDLVGGTGGDWLTGGPAPDDMAGGPGQDHVNGIDGAGGDHVNGGPNADICLHDTGDIVTSCP